MDQKKSGIILSYISLWINILTGILYTPIMLRMLGQHEYGIYELVNSIVAYLNLLNLGLTSSYIKFYTKEKINGTNDDISKVNGMFMQMFLVISAIALILGILMITNIQFIGEKYTEQDFQLARFLMFFMLINMVISFPNALFVAFMSAKEEFVYQRLIIVICNIAMPLINIPLLYNGGGSKGIIVVTSILTLVRFILNVFFCLSKLNMKFIFKDYKSGLFKELMSFTFFIFLSDVVDQLNQNIDKFLLGRLIGAVSVAIYSVGFSLKLYFTTLSWVIPEVFIPKVNRLVEENDNKGVNTVFVNTGRMSNFVLMPVILGFIIFGKKFVCLWAGNNYSESYYVAVILIISGYIPAIQSIGVNIQNALNKHQIRSIVYFVIAIANVILSIRLIPKYGAVGTSIGTLIAVLLGSGIFMNMYYHKKIGLDMFEFWKEIVKMYPAALVSFFVGYILERYLKLVTWGNLCIELCIFVIFYVVFMWKFALKTEEKDTFINILKKVKRIA